MRNLLLERYADPEFVKAFQLAQLLVEYLLIVQDTLANKERTLKKELETLYRRNETLETQNKNLSSRFEVRITDSKTYIRT